jgi:hypothetical protein
MLRTTVRPNKKTLKHGYHSAEAIQQRKAVFELIRRSRKVFGLVG